VRRQYNVSKRNIAKEVNKRIRIKAEWEATAVGQPGTSYAGRWRQPLQ
jgi:hypothetical protein